MSKYNEGWKEANEPKDREFELIPALIIFAAAEMIVILSLINNCGGFLL